MSTTDTDPQSDVEHQTPDDGPEHEGSPAREAQQQRARRHLRDGRGDPVGATRDDHEPAAVQPLDRDAFLRQVHAGPPARLGDGGFDGGPAMAAAHVGNGEGHGFPPGFDKSPPA